MIGVVGSEPVIELPPGARQPAPVHRADGDAVLEGAEPHEILEDVGAAEHAVDPGVLQRRQQPVEHRAAIGHRQRVVAHADHAASGVVGGDDEQHAVARQPVATATARRQCLADVPGIGDAHLQQLAEPLVGEPHCAGSKSSVISPSVGMASAHMRRDATIAPAALA